MARRGTKVPKANIFWRDIKPGMCVTDRGYLFEVRVSPTKRAVAFWTGQDAAAAQKFLRMRATKACKR